MTLTGGSTIRLFRLVYRIGDLLIAFVTYGEPTPSNYYMHDASPLKGYIGLINGRHMVRPGISLVGTLVYCILAEYKKSAAVLLGDYLSGCCALAGPAIPALTNPLARLVSVSSSSMLGAGSLEATWR